MQGSYNAIFKVVGEDKLVLRKPLGGAYRDLLTATYKQGPALLRHLRAACRLHRGNMRSIGVRIMGLLPVVNGHVPDLTTRKALDDLRTTRNVVIAMVMEELTPTDKAAKALALLAQARQVNGWAAYRTDTADLQYGTLSFALFYCSISGQAVGS